MSERSTEHRAGDESSGVDRRVRQPGRNIILLSDGTGNSAAKVRKTNVWRLYQALSVGDGTQVAFYDDGVGTSGFKPLRLLGGAIGVGLPRNVRDLYRFLCQHYRGPDETYAGDRIYIFGFSRGAFTARTVADLICCCGILNPSKSVAVGGFRLTRAGQVGLNTDRGIDIGVRLAYKAYRRKYAPPIMTRLFRAVRDLFFRPIPTVEDFRESHSYPDDEPIEAIGVWDTVAAYGLPIDELSVVVDQLIYKHRFAEHNLSPKVQHAYHALAIDDERQTFHPVLWNEEHESDPKRIQQVWFPGMHSDVGGGYADGDLSLLSLNWMLQSLKRAGEDTPGLDFDARSLDDIARRAAATAPMHDSRSGFGIYYRYKPRFIDALNNDPIHKISVARAKVHESVLRRIEQNTHGYSPRGLPTSFDVVDDAGTVVDISERESSEAKRQRVVCQTRLRSHVFWRRVNYFAMVFATAMLFAMPWMTPGLDGGDTTLGRWLASGWRHLEGYFFDFLGVWADSWIAAPVLFLGLLAAVGGLVLYAHHLQRTIHRFAEAGWNHLKQHRGVAAALPSPGPFERAAHVLLGQPRVRTLYHWCTHWILPVLTVVAVLYLTFEASVSFLGDVVLASL